MFLYPTLLVLFCALSRDYVDLCREMILGLGYEYLCYRKNEMNRPKLYSPPTNVQLSANPPTLMEISDRKTTNMEEPDDLSDGDVNIVSEQNEPRSGELRVGPSYNVTLSNIQRTVSSSLSEMKLTAITYNISR